MNSILIPPYSTTKYSILVKASCKVIVRGVGAGGGNGGYDSSGVGGVGGCGVFASKLLTLQQGDIIGIAMGAPGGGGTGFDVGGYVGAGGAGYFAGGGGGYGYSSGGGGGGGGSSAIDINGIPAFIAGGGGGGGGGSYGAAGGAARSASTISELQPYNGRNGVSYGGDGGGGGGGGGGFGEGGNHGVDQTYGALSSEGGVQGYSFADTIVVGSGITQNGYGEWAGIFAGKGNYYQPGHIIFESAYGKSGLFTNVNGNIKTIDGIYHKVNGTWKEVGIITTKQTGALKGIFQTDISKFLEVI